MLPSNKGGGVFDVFQSLTQESPEGAPLLELPLWAFLFFVADVSFRIYQRVKFPPHHPHETAVYLISAVHNPTLPPPFRWKGNLQEGAAWR